MTPVKFYRITSSQLNLLPIVNGQVIYTTDTGETYQDISDTERVPYKRKIVISAGEPQGLFPGDIWLVATE